MSSHSPALLEQAQQTLLTPFGLAVADLETVFSTIMGSLPCMMTLPARISWAIFMVWCSSVGLSVAARAPGFEWRGALRRMAKRRADHAAGDFSQSLEF